MATSEILCHVRGHSSACAIVFEQQAPISSQPQRLGSVLQAAGLLSASQLEVALWDQTLYWDLRLGEILDLHGWVNQQTSDFFVTHFLTTQVEPEQHRLGFYLKEASLLSNEQILTIVEQQLQSHYKFGELAVQSGWLQQQTLDFLLMHLFPSVESSPLSEASPLLKTPSIVIPHFESKSTVLQLEQNPDAWVSWV
ncbi:MAG: hypothetical protein ACFCU8_20115 [Thermosynechococcaceae cyanobacterium]